MNQESQKEKEDGILSILKKIEEHIVSPEFKDVLDKVKEKEVNFFVGNTRSGKSTLINCLIGNKMEVVCKRAKKYYIINTDPSSGPVIGLSSISTTTLPGVWETKLLSGLIVDAPGFEDNRGQVQDIANAFWVKQIITNASSVKIGVVVDINDIISDNVSQFVKVVDYLHDMLKDSSSVLKGTAVIFNKDKEGFSCEEIADLLQNTILLQKEIVIKNRKMITHLCENQAQISIMRMPNKVGTLNELAIASTIQSIDKSTVPINTVELTNVNPGISVKSHIFLLESFHYLTEQNDLENVLEKFKSKTKDLFCLDSKSNELSRKDVFQKKIELIKIKQKLQSLAGSNLKMQDSLNTLSQLLTGDSVEKIDKDICTKLEFLVFIDSITGTNQSKALEAKLKSFIACLVVYCEELEISFEEKLSNITKEEAEQKMNDLQNEMNLILQNLLEIIVSLQNKDDCTLKNQLNKHHLILAAGTIAANTIRDVTQLADATFKSGVQGLKYLGNGFMNLFS